MGIVDFMRLMNKLSINSWDKTLNVDRTIVEGTALFREEAGRNVFGTHYFFDLVNRLLHSFC